VDLLSPTGQVGDSDLNSNKDTSFDILSSSWSGHNSTYVVCPMRSSAKIRMYDAEDVFDMPSSRGQINENLVEILKQSDISRS